MLYLDQPALKTIEHTIQQVPGGISFAQGALRIGGVDRSIHISIQELLETDKADYYVHSLGIASLRTKLAETLTTRYGVSIAFESVIVTHGSINGIAALCLLLLEAGDEVVLPDPTYPSFINTLSVAKAAIKFVAAYTQVPAGNGTRWQVDLDAIKNGCSAKTKMIIIPHPSNPTGACMTQEEIEDLGAFCEERKIYIIFDEAYENYFFDVPVSSATPLVPDRHYIIRTGSFSKTFGMSGWRVGYVVAPKKVINHMAAIQDGLIVCPSAIGQYAALYALDNPEIASQYTEYMRKNREIVYDALQPLVNAGKLFCPRSGGGFYLFIQTSELDATALVYDMLEKAQVAVVPGKDFGPHAKEFFRLCYARKTDLLEEGLERLVNYFSH